jgi:hypothetical protein
MTAVQRFKTALQQCQIDEKIVAEFFAGYENISDKSPKETKVAFFSHAIRRMDDLLDADTCHAVRDACACSKGGWRLKAAQKIAKDCAGKSLEEKIAALNRVTHMGQPVLNADSTLTAHIGETGGFECPCPVFQGLPHEPVSITYCYCCAGHFRFHYQIALGLNLKTKTVLSSALESDATRPCRFVFEIED